MGDEIVKIINIKSQIKSIVRLIQYVFTSIKIKKKYYWYVLRDFVSIWIINLWSKEDNYFSSMSYIKLFISLYREHIWEKWLNMRVKEKK